MELIQRLLAVYAVTIAVTQKDGLFNVFRNGRQFIISKAPPKHKENIETGLTCPVCFSFYAAVAIILLPERIVSWLALAGFVVVVEAVKPPDWSEE